MGKFLCWIYVAVLIFLALLGAVSADSMPAVEAVASKSASEEYQDQQNQGIVQEDFKIKVNVELVTVDVTVIGTSVSELRAEDFIIYDNDISQQVNYFSLELLPLAVAVLIDRSSSVARYLPVLQIAAILSLRHLKPEDQVALFSFDSNCTKLSDLTQDRLLIAEKINTIKIGGGTNIYDAIYSTARYLSSEAPNHRRAIILVSDNCHTAEEGNKAERARIEMLEAAATLYSIKTPAGYGMNKSCYESSAQVKRIADETGGEVLDVQASTSLQSALERAMSNLRFQYTVGFSPSNPGENGSFHRLAVKLTTQDRCPGCRLLARSGYYAGITAPIPPLKDTQLTPRDSTKKTDQLLIQRSIFTAGTTVLDLPDITFKIRTAEQADSNGQPQLKVDLQIDSAKIGFKTVEDRHVCRLHITIFYADEKGKILGSDWKTLEGLLSEETYNRIMEEGILFSTTIPIKAQKEILKVVIYDEESGKVGSKLVGFP